MMRAITLFALLLLTALPAVAAERAEFGSSSYTFTAVDCVVTDVRLAEDLLTLDIRGRLSSDAPGTRFADTDKNSMCFTRDGGSEESWSALVAKAKAAMDKRAAISIRSGGYAMMSGIPFFQIPRDAVEILVLEDR
jgi:hypothetical protein